MITLKIGTAYKTRNGNKAEIHAKRATRASFPFIGVVFEEDTVLQNEIWTRLGRHYYPSGDKSPYDIVGEYDETSQDIRSQRRMQRKARNRYR